MALIDNLISYYKLDEASGNALDAHGSNTLTDTNTVASGTGKISGARSFEADNSEYFTVADNADFSTGDIDFTIQAWVNLASKTGQRAVVGKWVSGQLEYILIYESGSDTFQFFVSSDGSAAVSVAATVFGSPTVGDWNLIHCWHDATNDLIGIAVNAGTANTTNHSAGVHDGTASFDIGRNPAGAFMDGLLDEVGFWKRVLTSTERTALYNSGDGLAYDDASFGGAGGGTPTADPDDVTIVVAVTAPTVVFTAGEAVADPDDVTIAVAVTTPTVVASVTVDPDDVTIAVAVTAPTVEYTEAPVADATAYTLVGPASGRVDSPSGLFSVASNGSLASAVTITPSDGADGGSFSPATVELAAGDFTSATFRYTPASTGAKTISVTDSSTLTDPTSLSFEAREGGGAAITTLNRRRRWN